MKIRSWAAALALCLVLPAALAAQDGRGRGYMGILFGWNEDGAATVRQVTPGSPAERAGIRAGDVVLGIDGRPATRDAVDALRDHLARGDSVRLRVRHEGREDERVVVAAERPDRMVFTVPNEMPGGVWHAGDHRIVIRMDTLAVHMDSLLQRMDSLRSHLRMRTGDSIVIRVDTLMRVWRDSLVRNLPRAELEFRRAFPMIYDFGSRSMGGAEFAEMNAGLGRHFGTDHGLLVTQVGPGTPAARGGLQAGDVVVEANGHAVNRPTELREAFTRADGQSVRLTVLRDGHRQEVNVRWEAPESRVWRVAPSRVEIRRP